MVSREGALIEVPGHLAEQSATALAAYLKFKIEAAANGNLNQYLLSQQ